MQRMHHLRLLRAARPHLVLRRLRSTQLLEEADVAPALQEFRSEGPNSLVAPLPAVAPPPPPAPPPPELTAGNAASITGTLAEIVFRSANGYTVARFESVPEEGGRKRSTVVMAYDCLATARPGERFELRGRWEQHPKFGRQLRVDSQCAAQFDARNFRRAILRAPLRLTLPPSPPQVRAPADRSRPARGLSLDPQRRRSQAGPRDHCAVRRLRPRRPPRRRARRRARRALRAAQGARHRPEEARRDPRVGGGVG